jgi:hypothetical protein
MRRFDRVLGAIEIIPPKTAHAGRNLQNERDLSRLWFRGAGLSIMPLLLPESGVQGHVGVVAGVPAGASGIDDPGAPSDGMEWACDPEATIALAFETEYLFRRVRHLDLQLRTRFGDCADRHF